MKRLIFLCLLLTGCETSVVWYETHPQKKCAEVEGQNICVVPRGGDYYDAFSDGIFLIKNMLEQKDRHVRAVEQATGCKVVEADSVQGRLLFNTKVNCNAKQLTH